MLYTFLCFEFFINFEPIQIIKLLIIIINKQNYRPGSILTLKSSKKPISRWAFLTNFTPMFVFRIAEAEGQKIPILENKERERKGRYMKID